MFCAEPWGAELHPSKLWGTQISKDPNWVSGVCLCPSSTGLLAKIAQSIKITE